MGESSPVDHQLRCLVSFLLIAWDEPGFNLTMIPRTGTFDFLPSPMCTNAGLLFLILKKFKLLPDLGI